MELSCSTAFVPRKIPVYNDDCKVDENGVHTTGCQVRMYVILTPINPNKVQEA